jgi:hypothetical protein
MEMSLYFYRVKHSIFCQLYLQRTDGYCCLSHVSCLHFASPCAARWAGINPSEQSFMLLLLQTPLPDWPVNYFCLFFHIIFLLICSVSFLQLPLTCFKYLDSSLSKHLLKFMMSHHCSVTVQIRNLKYTERMKENELVLFALCPSTH